MRSYISPLLIFLSYEPNIASVSLRTPSSTFLLFHSWWKKYSVMSDIHPDQRRSWYLLCAKSPWTRIDHHNRRHRRLTSLLTIILLCIHAYFFKSYRYSTSLLSKDSCKEINDCHWHPRFSGGTCLCAVLSWWHADRRKCFRVRFPLKASACSIFSGTRNSYPLAELNVLRWSRKVESSQKRLHKIIWGMKKKKHK